MSLNLHVGKLVLCQRREYIEPMKTSLVKFVIAVSLTLAFSFFAQAQNETRKPMIRAIAVNKSLRTMQLLDSKFKIYKTYNISLGSDPLGPKHQSGDGKTPEGRYVINSKNPNSKYHLSLGVSYPNSYDRRNAKAEGVNPGGDIMIHGIGEYGWVGAAHTLLDWTQGCIAVTNEEIEEIYSLVHEGTVIYIWP